MNRSMHFTPQRKSVYDTVRASADHPTAGEVMERLRQSGHKLAYATVYNSLRYLTDAGVIQELKMGSGAVRYDARLEAHQHIVCTACGRVDEVFAPVPTDYLGAIAKETGYRVHHVDAVAKGLCPECAKSR